MTQRYSLANAGKITALGVSIMGLAAAFQAAVHHSAGHFITYSEAFAHVAQPLPVLIAAGLSVAIGAGIELTRWYNAGLDREDAAQAKPATPNAKSPLIP